MEIADEIFVLRHGVMGGHIRKEDTSPYELTRMMVDHEPKEFTKEETEPGEEALCVENLTYTDNSGTRILNDLELKVRGGEIYGIAGIEGNGQLEFMEIVSGIIKGWRGNIRIFGSDVKKKSTREDYTDGGFMCSF